MEPLISTVLPEGPWMCVGADILTIEGRNYLTVEDYFSRYPEVVLLQNMTSMHIINKIKGIFARFGIPKILRADNGSQFDCKEFREFGKQYGFTLTTSSPRYAKSNGFAEASVKSVKKILQKSKVEDPNLALLAYRTSPLESGYSPSELLFGRKLRTNIPTHPSSLEPKWPDLKKFREKDRELKERQKRNHDSRHKAVDLPELQQGEEVWITDLKRYGKVIKMTEEPRSYLLKSAGRVIRRNRFHLIPTGKIHSPEQMPYPFIPPYSNSQDNSLSIPSSNQPPVAVSSQSLDSTTEPTNGPLELPGEPPEQPVSPRKSLVPPQTEVGSQTGKTTRSGRRVKPAQKMNL